MLKRPYYQGFPKYQCIEMAKNKKLTNDASFMFAFINEFYEKYAKLPTNIDVQRALEIAGWSEKQRTRSRVPINSFNILFNSYESYHTKNFPSAQCQITKTIEEVCLTPQGVQALKERLKFHPDFEGDRFNIRYHSSDEVFIDYIKKEYLEAIKNYNNTSQVTEILSNSFFKEQQPEASKKENQEFEPTLRRYSILLSPEPPESLSCDRNGEFGPSQNSV